jgi:hypothetical protein
LESQPLATDSGFRNVSQAWFGKTRPIDEVLEEAEQHAASAESISRRLNQLTPMAVDGNFRLRDDRSGRLLKLTEYSLQQLGRITGAGSAYPLKLFRSSAHGAAELLEDVLVFHTNHSCRSGSYNLRIRNDGQVMGFLGEHGYDLRNVWFLKVLRRIIPDARVSHWKGSPDTMLGNLLIPDTIREESDSEYGAMVAVSNCEVRSRAFYQRPSLFRAICMNGCIWGKESGQELTRDRLGRGDLDLGDVERMIRTNIEEQIPLSVVQLDHLLATRQLSTDVSIKPVIAQLSKDYRLSKGEGSAVLAAWRVEQNTTPDFGSTLFGLINAVTRAGQQLDADRWVEFDQFGGQLVLGGEDRWSDLVRRASKLSSKQVDGAFAPWQLTAA